jgi:hypothetical protein
MWLLNYRESDILACTAVRTDDWFAPARGLLLGAVADGSDDSDSLTTESLAQSRPAISSLCKLPVSL